MGQIKKIASELTKVCSIIGKDVGKIRISGSGRPSRLIPTLLESSQGGGSRSVNEYCDWFFIMTQLVTSCMTLGWPCLLFHLHQVSDNFKATAIMPTT